MKKLFFLLLIGATLATFAQKDEEYDFDGILRKISFGGGLNAKLGYNISDLPYDIGSGINVGFDIDAIYYMPMSDDKESGLMITASYHSYPFGLTLKSIAGDISQTHNYTYLAIGGDFVYNNLMAGINLGLFPISGSRTESGNSFELNSSLMGTTIDARIGYMYNIFEDEGSSANLVGRLSYTISPIYKENLTGIRNEVTSETMQYNFTPLTLSVGVNYLFKME